MKMARRVLALGAVSAVTVGAESPIGKVLQLISDLQAKVIKEGEQAQKLYAEYAEWCEDRARSLVHSIATGGSQVTELQAAIGEHAATIASETSKIEALAADISTDEADLNAATGIRGKETADFAKEEAELVDTISVVERAIAVLEREAAKGKGGAALLQSAGSLAKALDIMVQASSLSSTDAAKLTAFVQGRTSSEQAADEAEDEAALSAPEAAAYESHSSNIVETLQGLLEKAEKQLEDLRNTEVSSKHNFEMLQQSLQDEVKVANRDMGESKSALAAAGEAKATAEGDLESTTKDLAEDTVAKEELHHSCMTKAQDFESETQGRGEELHAIAEAKRIIQEQTGGAEKAVSLLQVSGLSTSADLKGSEVVHMLRDLARHRGDAALAQLADRAAAAIRIGLRGGQDPFGKVKDLISQMISKLESESSADATKKTYCDKEMSESESKKLDKSTGVEHLTTKLEQADATSAKLKEEIAELGNTLSSMASSQAEIDQLRQKEHEAFVTTKADLEQGVTAVRSALKVLREYYAAKDEGHVAATGSASGVVGLLEVVESDFAKGLAEVMAVEEAAVSEHNQLSKENEVERKMKDKDIEYKTKEAASLDKSAAELRSDRTGVQAELDAILEYLARLQEECIAKADSYETRAARREAELAGLKEALAVLESEMALVQRGARRHRAALRGGASALVASS